MRKRVLRNKPMVFDGQRYLASVSATYDDEVVHLRVTIRADFGTRSFVVIKGLQNFDYFHHYGHWTNQDYSETKDTIEITPRVLAVLIQHARNNGWSPESEKTNRHLELTNVNAKSLLAEYNERQSDGGPT
ncbi:hypothetical protein Poly51_11630 [Rubripirellula tenax]|uniref:Uncharacterized protein n=1 Tax=Rubripirellula tenax TaxID=2528015 RepID=A0A5C6FH82_9BACT|nr:hypothetical protein [Rubripirellula tenax]TWU60881.1 hypothetical protein Poly51_11630 [Rubripirellula tenax]